MKVKAFLATIIATLFIIFSTSCFATNDMANTAGNGVRNVVNGAGNVVEGATRGAGNVIQGIAGGIGQGMSNIGNGIQNMTQGDMANDNDRNNNDGYTATRTSAMTNSASNGTFLGMNGTTWSWVIMGILGVSIIALVWFYGKQHEDGYIPNHDEDR